MSEKFHNVLSLMTKSFRIDEQAIEELRIILEEQNKRQMTYDEAEQIGRSLVTVIETLANGRIITAETGGSDADR